MTFEYRVEAITPRRLRNRPGHELMEVDGVAGERLDRTVERSRLVVGRE